MIRRHWVRRYDQLPPRSSSEVIQSWDTASKAGAENDWSACTTWFYYESKYYLADVLRDRYDYPTLKARAISNARYYEPDKILIEDTGVGPALIGELKQFGFPAIAIQPEHDKLTRISIQSGKFESGQVFLPNQAQWLAELETELFGFPNVRFDDQVDSISQALKHQSSGCQWNKRNLAGLANFTNALLLQRRFGFPFW
jgi:predicted phage terminase large subunit-like protein